MKPNNNNTDALHSLHLQSLFDVVTNRNVFHGLFVFAYLFSTTLEKHKFLYCSEQ